MSKNSRRISWTEADEIRKKIDGIAQELKLKQYEVAGSYRRKRPDCGDIDLCIREQDYGKWAQAITRLAKTGDDVLVKQKDGTVTGVMYDGTRIEFYVAQKDAFGAMLLFCTGSWEWNVYQRNVAVAMGMKLNEKGLWKQTTSCPTGEVGDWYFVAGKTEAEIFSALGMPWCDPEGRERGNGTGRKD